jgi:hypothetical protein
MAADTNPAPPLCPEDAKLEQLEALQDSIAAAIASKYGDKAAIAVSSGWPACDMSPVPQHYVVDLPSTTLQVLERLLGKYQTTAVVPAARGRSVSFKALNLTRSDSGLSESRSEAASETSEVSGAETEDSTRYVAMIGQQARC